jgi:ubiquinone biosynthesis protein COQ9
VTQRLALARLQESLDAEENEGKKLGVGAKVKKLTWERLMANKEVIHRWQEVRLYPPHNFVPPFGAGEI